MYFKKKSGKKKDIEVVELPINIEMFDSIIQYTLSDNPLITKKSLINLRKLINFIDIRSYSEDFSRMLRIELLKKILEGELDQNIYRDALLKEYCIKELPHYSKDLLELFESGYFDEPLSNDDITFINKFVEENLTYIHLRRHSPDLEMALQQLRASDSSNLRSINNTLERIVGELNKDIKSAKAVNQYAAMDFNINGNTADSVVRATIEEYKKPNNHLKLGIKNLNKMLDGGVENGRVYLIFGLPKGFKSGTLLNIAIWICKYNREIVTKDKTKKPCVLYVTQENSIRETLQRIFVHSTGSNIENYTEEEALRIIREEVIGVDENGEAPIDLFIKYRPNKSISTSDLDTMCDDLELEGYEVVCLIQDYTKRIRSSSYNPSDLRLELGSVVDDFTVIAKTRNIPVISAGQLNREAYRILETSLEKGKSNIGKNLNASHIGESALMQENTDYGVIVNKEEFEGVEYLTFKLIASRAKKPSITYFAHPFEKDNGLRLMDDIHLAKSLSEDKIGGDKFKEFNPNKARENKGSFFNNNNVNQPEFPPVDLKVEANNGIEKDSGIPF